MYVHVLKTFMIIIKNEMLMITDIGDVIKFYLWWQIENTEYITAIYSLGFLGANQGRKVQITTVL